MATSVGAGARARRANFDDPERGRLRARLSTDLPLGTGSPSLDLIVGRAVSRLGRGSFNHGATIDVNGSGSDGERTMPTYW